jgi:hypothetical protein
MGDDLNSREPDDLPPLLPKPAMPVSSLPVTPHGDTLAYRNEHVEAPDRRRKFAAQLAGGLCSSLLICGGCFVLLFVIGASYVNYSGSGRNSSAPPMIWAWLGLLVVLGVVVGQIWFAVRLKRTRGWNGVLVGALIGIGLALLPLGACYVMIAASLTQQ